MSTIVGKIDIDAFEGDGLDIIGTDGFDILFGTDKSELIDAKGGNDIVIANGGSDLIIGGAGNDTIQAGLGDDLVIGGEGNDIIQGEAGDDCIEGGSGSDTMIGGQGADVFGFDVEDFANGEKDIIGDFNIDEDTIVIRGLGDDDKVAFDAFTNTITVNGDSIITVGGTSVSDLEIDENDDGDYIIM